MVNYSIQDDNIEFVKQLANRFIDYEELKKILIFNKEMIDFYELPCLTILFGELSKIEPENEWDKIAFTYLSQINNDMEDKALNASTFSGLSGVGYAILANYKEGKRYGKFLKSVNELIVKIVSKHIKQEEFTMKTTETINGLSGIGRYLLYFKDDLEVEETIRNIIRAIIKFSEEKEVDGNSLPGWYVPIEYEKEMFREMFPNGKFIFGISHGITGILAFLSIALINGIKVEGQIETIYRILDFIMKFKFNNQGRTYFPSFLSLEEYLSGEVTQGKNKLGWDYASWCYGNSGYARSIYLAGKAVNNNKYTKYGIDLMLETTRCIEDGVEKLGFIEPTFCHGYAGYMHVLNLFYRDVKIERFRETSEIIKDKILSLYSKEHFFGFESYDTERLAPQRSIGLTVSVLLPLIDFYKDNTSEWSGIYLIN